MQTGEDSNNKPANESKTPISPGGAGSSLDMNNPRDVLMVKRAIRDRPLRWAGVTAAVKQSIVDGLLDANETAQRLMHQAQSVEEAMSAARVVASVGSTFVAIEGQNQKDEHRADDLDRIDGGKATQAIKLYGRETPVDDV